MPYQIDSTERLKKAEKRLSAMSLEERYERVLILAREFLTAKAHAHHQSFQEASYEDAAFLVMSWQHEKMANPVVECLEWIISGTIRRPQTIPEVTARENFSQQAAVF